MSMQPATRTSKHPLGGISGDWRRRLLRFHLPLALASVLVLLLFETLPRFDASAYTALDMHSSEPFPQGREPMDMQDMDMDRGGDHDGPMDESADQPAEGHNGDRSARSTPAATAYPSGQPAGDHGGGQPAGDHGGDQPAEDHGGDEAEGMGGDS
jgi:hypothetical protein